MKVLPDCGAPLIGFRFAFRMPLCTGTCCQGEGQVRGAAAAGEAAQGCRGQNGTVSAALGCGHPHRVSHRFIIWAGAARIRQLCGTVG
eukprot:1160000-Pelagomonas_calceolata.AAC.10